MFLVFELLIIIEIIFGCKIVSVGMCWGRILKILLIVGIFICLIVLFLKNIYKVRKIL